MNSQNKLYRFLYFILVSLLSTSLLFFCVWLLNFSLKNYFENKFYSNFSKKYFAEREVLIKQQQNLNESLDTQFKKFVEIYSKYVQINKEKEQLAKHLEYFQDMSNILADKIYMISKIKKRPSDNKDLYLVVNTDENKLYMRRGDTTLKEFTVATGFKKYLKDKESNITKLISITPKDVMTVRKLQQNPVWVKPDWFYTENKLPIPPLDSPKRRDYKTLGKYGIYLQDRYIIHGVKSKKDIGKNVSHGCIRMLEHDLKIVYNNVRVGTDVYIY